MNNNPFTQGLKIVYNEIEIKRTYYKSSDGLLLPAVVKVERQKGCKVYTDKNTANKLLNLSASGLRLFAYILAKLQPATDTIVLKPASLKPYLSSNSLKKAIQELRDIQLIAPADTKYLYIINPAYL